MAKQSGSFYPKNYTQTFYEGKYVNVKSYHNAANIKAMVMAFCLMLTMSSHTVAQTPNSSTTPAPETEPPSAALITEAQRFAQIAGQTLSGQPQEWSDSMDQQTGHTVWKMRWVPDPDSSNAVEVKVDAVTVKAVNYSDDLALAASSSAFNAGQMLSVTQEQAVAKLEMLMAGLPVALGDWRLENQVTIKRYGDSNGQPGMPYWLVTKSRYVDGLPAPGVCVAHINPYSGQVYGWFTQDYAVLSRPSGAILTEAQAQQIAYNTYRQLTDLPGTLVQSNLVWATLNSSTTLTRLQYGFGYETPPVTTPAPDPNYPDEAVTEKYFLSVVVDAETGEVLHADWGGGTAGSGGDKRWSPTPRLQLLDALFKVNEQSSPDPLVLALVSSRSAKAAVPSNAPRQFTRAIGGKSIRFALNTTKCRLTWEVKPGEWAGIALTGKHGLELAAWLDKETERLPLTAYK